MSEKPLIIDTEPPSAFVARGEGDHGTIDLNIVGAAIEDAQRISFGIDVNVNDSDEIRQLKQQLHGLADTVTELAGQLYQLGHAIEVGRIAVHPREF